MEKPRLSFWQIWNMSFGFLGIQFGFALQNANVSRIFETLGASIDWCIYGYFQFLHCDTTNYCGGNSRIFCQDPF